MESSNFVAFKSTDFKSHSIYLLCPIMKKINSIQELRNEAKYNEGCIAEFFIVLNFGAKSSKRITYYPDSDTYDVLNEIDYTYQDNLTEDQLRSQTLIIEAIEKGALFKYE